MNDYKDNQEYFKRPPTLKDNIIESLKMALVGGFILYLMFHALWMGISGRL